MTDYFDMSKVKSVRFSNLKKTTKSISLRLPVDMIEELKVKANSMDVPYMLNVIIFVPKLMTLMSSLNKRRIWIDEHPEYFQAKAQNLAIFWTVVTLPLGGVGLYRGSYGAYMWAYRNPVVVGDFITGFSNPAFLNPFNPAHRAGFIARKTFEAMTR